MKLAELLFEEKLGDYFGRLIKQHGIKKLGGGAYSQVFQHPEFHNVVVKVYTDKDTVYKRYVSWCMKHQDNPYVPKIIEQVKFKSPSGENYNIVFMQKMKPIRGHTAYVKALSAVFKTNKLKLEDLKLIRSLGQYGQELEDFEAIDELVEAGKADKSFEEVWRHIKTYGAAKFDMHIGNVMMRDNQLVLTDPVAHDPTVRIDEL